MLPIQKRSVSAQTWAQLLAKPLAAVASFDELRRLRRVCVDFRNEIDRLGAIELCLNPALEGFDAWQAEKLLSHSSRIASLAGNDSKKYARARGTIQFAVPPPYALMHMYIAKSKDLFSGASSLSKRLFQHARLDREWTYTENEDNDVYKLYEKKLQHMKRLLSFASRSSSFEISVQKHAANFDFVRQWLEGLDAQQEKPFALAFNVRERHTKLSHMPFEMDSYEKQDVFFDLDINRALMSLPRSGHLYRLDLSSVDLAHSAREEFFALFSEMSGLRELSFRNTSSCDKNSWESAESDDISSDFKNWKLPQTLERLAIYFPHRRFGYRMSERESAKKEILDMGRALIALKNLRYFSFSDHSSSGEGEIWRILFPSLSQVPQLLDLDLGRELASRQLSVVEQQAFEQLLMASPSLGRIAMPAALATAAIDSTRAHVFDRPISLFYRPLPTSSIMRNSMAVVRMVLRHNKEWLTSDEPAMIQSCEADLLWSRF